MYVHYKAAIKNTRKFRFFKRFLITKIINVLKKYLIRGNTETQLMKHYKTINFTRKFAADLK